MRLTPLDIRKQDFEKGFRGYEIEEVQSFLQMLSTQWEEVLAEQRRLEQRVRELEAKLQHYTNVEEALQEALRTARETSRNTLDAANKKAEDIIAEANREADRMRADMHRERSASQRLSIEAGQKRDEIVARLRAFLNAEIEVLERFDASAASEGRPSGARRAAAGSGGDSLLSQKKEPVESFYSRTSPSAQTPAPARKPPASSEEERNAGWTVRPVVASPAPASALVEKTPSAASAPDSPTPSSNMASPDELERIRRILNDLD